MFVIYDLMSSYDKFIAMQGIVYTFYEYCITKKIFNQVNYQCIQLFLMSSSSSYRAGSTDIPDPLSPFLPIVHRLR